jgi:hypothetical protein
VNNVVFSFSKPSPNSTVVSNRLATFIAKTLRLPLVYDEQIHGMRSDILIIVNGAFAFCKHLDDLASAIRLAERVVWVQNDYTIKPPAAVSGAESPFRKAFRYRHRRGAPPTDFWTTLKEPPDVARGVVYYVNWNQLTYTGKPDDIARRPYNDKDLFYYGAFRMGRRGSFDKYFAQKKVPVSILSTSSKFSTAYPRAQSVVPLRPLHLELRRHGLGLYIEDRKSHTEFHSPANRFYEMLSAGLPMVFEPEAAPMLLRAGFDVHGCVARNGKDLREAVERRIDIATFQRDSWHRPYRDELRSRLKKVYRTYLQSI